MKNIILVAFIVGLSGCATRGAVESLREGQTAQAKTEIETRSAWREKYGFVLSQLDRLEKRIDAVEESTLGPWDNDECERYTLEAQRLFCHRKPRFAPYVESKPNRFEKPSKKAREMTDAEFEKALNDARQKADKDLDERIKKLLEGVRGLKTP